MNAKILFLQRYCMSNVSSFQYYLIAGAVKHLYMYFYPDAVASCICVFTTASETPQQWQLSFSRNYVCVTSGSNDPLQQWSVSTECLRTRFL